MAAAVKRFVGQGFIKSSDIISLIGVTVVEIADKFFGGVLCSRRVCYERISNRILTISMSDNYKIDAVPAHQAFWGRRWRDSVEWSLRNQLGDRNNSAAISPNKVYSWRLKVSIYPALTQSLYVKSTK